MLCHTVVAVIVPSVVLFTIAGGGVGGLHVACSQSCLLN